MVDFYLYVEGGGEHRTLHDACRRAFAQFLQNAGVTKNRPRIVACGGRSRAFDKFRTGLEQGQHALLLVDSEAAVTEESPWTHLQNRPGDGWTKPDNATDGHCHLMVQSMENWFLADRETLRTFFGQDFRDSALPKASRNIETIPHRMAFQALIDATKNCKPGRRYSKGERSFELLERIAPAKVTSASKWAERFIAAVKKTPS